MKSVIYFTLLTLLLITFSTVNAQYVSPKLGYGIEVGGARGDNAGKSEDWVPRLRGHIQMKVASPILAQFGFSYANLKVGDTATSYSNKLFLADVRFLARPFKMNKMFPFVFVGFGAGKDMSDSKSTYLPIIPAGLGVQTELGQRLILQVHYGYNLALSDKLDGRVRDDNHLNRFTRGKQDGFSEIMVGVIYTGPPVDPDPDRDGMSNAEEAKYNTNPKKADTDNDGINDGDEILKYQTDPLKLDSDADVLLDGEEVLKYKTNPLKADTDADGLDDYAEVSVYHIDPLMIDTDMGGMNDGAEIKIGQNPLDTKDDMPDLFDLTVKGNIVVLHGINFETGNAIILPGSELVLNRALKSLMANPEVKVVITGHTDSEGADDYNWNLSMQRAQTVADWLIVNGINADRLVVVGKGETQPIAPNDTEDGKAKNRRIEFTVE